MEPELEEALYMEFPYLFRPLFEDQYHSTQQQPSHPHVRQIRIRSGWYKILYNLCLALNAIIAKEGLDPTQVYFTTIKQKFGVLRVYMRYGSRSTGDELGKAVAKASEESGRTCEECGEVGELRMERWWTVRCDGCYARWREERERELRRWVVERKERKGRWVY